MTLFLFVVMMLNLDLAPKRSGFYRYVPIGLMVFVAIIGALVYVLLPSHFPLSAMVNPPMHRLIIAILAH